MSQYNVDGSKKDHVITLEGRSEMSIKGVEEVMGFDEEGVRLRSNCGDLYIEGSDIKIGTLDTESGFVTLTGKIDAVYYATEGKEKRGIFSVFSR